ncbi:MAG: 3-hydroxybutyryl-CoA dehydrogenase [Rhizobiaceae bacterium]
MSGRIACLGAGRMGRGIAIAFAFAGRDVDLVDFKQRDPSDFARFEAEARDEIDATLAIMSRIGLLDAAHIARISARITIVPEARAGVLAEAEIIFEGLPEVVSLKHDGIRRASELAGPDPIIASTTSTFLVDELAGVVAHPGRFLNAHWLNPAFLVPLVEISPGRLTRPDVTARLKDVLDGIGKVPVLCAPTPGYIVGRIQALALNEAARLVEEGVATAEEIDKAIHYGFGFRYSVIGLLEFIDWGGGDTLFYASRYLENALQAPRYATPDIVRKNMDEGRIGMRTQRGFLDYAGMDLDDFREARLRAFAESLRRMKLAREPVL